MQNRRGENHIGTGDWTQLSRVGSLPSTTHLAMAAVPRAKKTAPNRAKPRHLFNHCGSALLPSGRELPCKNPLKARENEHGLLYACPNAVPVPTPLPRPPPANAALAAILSEVAMIEPAQRLSPDRPGRA